MPADEFYVEQGIVGRPDTPLRPRPEWLRLSDLRERAVAYDSLPAPIDPVLRRNAFISVGLLCLHLFLEADMTSVDHNGPPPFMFGGEVFLAIARVGGLLVPVVIVDSLLLALTIGLLAMTHGFQEAPEWGLRATLGVVGIGVVVGFHLILIVAIPIANIVAGIAIIAGMVRLAVALCDP